MVLPDDCRFNEPEPPDRPVILDARRGAKTKLIEPYNEGGDVILICEVHGGELIYAGVFGSHLSLMFNGCHASL